MNSKIERPSKLIVACEWCSKESESKLCYDCYPYEFVSDYPVIVCECCGEISDSKLCYGCDPRGFEWDNNASYERDLAKLQADTLELEYDEIIDMGKKYGF